MSHSLVDFSRLVILFSCYSQQATYTLCPSSFSSTPRFVHVQFCHKHGEPVPISFWCETCAVVFCGHCAFLNSYHTGHSINSVASKHAELRAHAATLTPRIATLAKQLEEETALTATLRKRAEALQTELQARAASFSELAVAPYTAQLELLKTFMTQTAARETKALANAHKTLGSIDNFKDALSIARLHRILFRPPGPEPGDGADGASEPRSLAYTPWATARAAFEAALTDAVETVTPRTAVCEVEVPLSALASSAAAVELGTAELCGVAFVCRVRRGCSCGAAPLVLAVEGSDASCALAPCTCAIVGEVEARTASDALAARYNECAARAKAVAELIDTEDADDNDDDDARENGAAAVARNGSDSKDTVFGTVHVEFAVAGAADQATYKCNVMLTDPNKRVTSVALAKHAELMGGSIANVRVRCTVAFPDLFHQARALQLSTDALSHDFAAAQRALAQGSAAAAAELASSVQQADELRRKFDAFVDLQRFAKSDDVFNKELLDAFNKHVAHVLESGGYPIICRNVENARLRESHCRFKCKTPAPAWTSGAPSTSLTALQPRHVSISLPTQAPLLG